VNDTASQITEMVYPHLSVRQQLGNRRQI